MGVIVGSQAAGMWFSFSPNIAEAAAASNRIISMRPPKDDGNKTPLAFQAEEGSMGSGKSTIISLLERFYDPDSGTILCGEQHITSVSTKSYRSHLSLVAQESTLYEGTVKENVGLSVSDAEATDEALEEACRQAQIRDFIVSLPEGYATKLGPKAVQLSGGQRQRLALARALLRKPRFLLLDEATSSLDSESEKLVQEGGPSLQLPIGWRLSKMLTSYSSLAVAESSSRAAIRSC